MSLTKAEAEQIVKEAIEQGWADKANSEEVCESGEGSVDMWPNYTGGHWDRSQAADHHDWGPIAEILARPELLGSTEACRRCHTTRDERTENRDCPGVWVNPQPTDTYHVELLFPGMYSSEKYWITEREDWRKLRAKVDELKEVITQAVERGWMSGSFSRAPKKSGKLGMYIEVGVPGTASYLPKRVGGMRTWRTLCREFDNVITQGETEVQVQVQGGQSRPQLLGPGRHGEGP